MALDTALRRASAINVGSPWRAVLPLPSGTVGAGAKATVLGLYSGVLPAVSSYYAPVWSALDPLTLTQYTEIPFTPTYWPARSCDVYAAAVPAVFSRASGEIPVGVTLTAAGELIGTPLNRGDFTMTVHVIDADDGEAVSGALVITVNAPASASSASREGESLGFGFGGMRG